MAESMGQQCCDNDQSGLKMPGQQHNKRVLEDNRESSEIVKQLQGLNSLSVKSPLQRNNTGLPDTLKSGMENLSGINLDDVRVHYNSDKPAAVQAHAYAQGSDIHLASGQEEHLPHELGHVVQQREGRVKPTMSIGGISVNDNQGLENEATRMGQRALQRTANTDSANNSKSIAQNPLIPNDVAQRKISFSGYMDPPQGWELFEVVKAAVEKNRELLEITFPDQFENTYAELQRYGFFKNILFDLIKSPVDYGVVNLDNPQHVVLLFKDAGKYLLGNYLEQRREEAPLVRSQEFDEEIWGIRRGSSPDETFSKVNTYKTALLGSSASVAYYLAVNGRSLNPKDTVIIASGEPWRPSESRESRGIEFVNHPMSMISPNRKDTQLSMQESGADETFAGNAQQITNDIGTVLASFPNRVNTRIEKISRQRNRYLNWYIIETGRGTYYAENVISGLGIGSHQKPRNSTANAITTNEEKREERKRVIDLDSFQRQLKNPDSDIMRDFTNKRYLSIGVSGPNAGVDAAYEATNKGMFVDWVVSGGPAIAEGMGNKVSRKGLVELYFDRVKSWTVSGEKVLMELGGKWGGDGAQHMQKEAEEEFLEKNPGWIISQKKNARVDYLVYATGPDTGQIWGLFDDSVTENLELKYDETGRFSGVGGESIKVSLEHSQYNVYWQGIRNRVAKVLGGDRIIQWEATRDALMNGAKAILGVQEFAAITLQTDVASGLGSRDNTLQIIGGSASRFLNYLDGTWRQERRNSVPEVNSKVPAPLRGGNTSEKMTKVINTLSSPTILGNDQLTPIRSQLEAIADYMPGYIGSEESNFVTDDQSMIAAQIAAYYANIPPELANWVTQKIIQDRHDNGVKPGTPQGSRAFVNKWEITLERLQELFSRENIRSIAEQI